MLPAAMHFYVDPGAGSMILQLLVGSAVGVLYFFGNIRRRVFELFSRRKK